MIRYVFAAMIFMTPAAVHAQQDHAAGKEHAVHNGSQAIAHEPGQAAFAAIQEIVGILVADPHTDWSTVNIDALRRHLVDMSNVTLYAGSRAIPVAKGMRYEVTGKGAVRASVRRMIMAHAMTMNGKGGWSYRAEDRAEGAALTVTAPNPAELAKLRGLGFFGVLALGMHHQEHHLMIARGHSPHH